MPRVGCALGGQWELVGAFVQKALVDREISVTVYAERPAQAARPAIVTARRGGGFPRPG